MLIGYARTSTLDQEAGLEAQQRELAKLGCERTFREQTSATGPRKALDEAIAFCRSGDTLVVTRLDRLARSVTHLWRIVEGLQSKGVALRIVAMGIDTGTATGKLMLTVLGGVAEFERETMPRNVSPTWARRVCSGCSHRAITRALASKPTFIMDATLPDVEIPVSADNPRRCAGFTASTSRHIV